MPLPPDQQWAYPMPSMESDCPNVQAASAAEIGATQVYNAANGHGDPRFEHSQAYQHAQMGLVAAVATRRAVETLCDGCPGVDEDGACPRQAQADRIFQVVPRYYSGTTVEVRNQVPGSTRLPRRVVLTVEE